MARDTKGPNHLLTSKKNLSQFKVFPGTVNDVYSCLLGDVRVL